MATGNMISVKVAHLKKRAEEELKQGNYGKAAARYTEAIDLLQHQPSKDVGQLRLLYSNRSLSWLKAGRAEAALQDATAATQLAPGWAKGYWRAGKTLSDMSRWPEAVAAFLQAWQKAAADSSEQRECEQQLVASVKQLTRQQLADMLLDRMQQQYQQQQQHLGGYITAAAVPLHLQHAQPSSHVQAPDIIPLHGAAQCMQYVAANCGSIVERSSSSSSSSGVEACTSSSSLLQPDSWQQQEELREAMFQLVKAAAAQPGATAHLSGLGYYQSMLLRWLKTDCSTTAMLKRASKLQQQQQPGLNRARNVSSGTASTAAAAADIEVSLLYSKLAVKCKQWAEAQRAAAAAEKCLQALVLPDQDDLMQLLLDCYITLGDSYMAASSRSTGNGLGSNSSSCSSQQQQLLRQCNPSAAATAYLTALNFAPDHRLLVARSAAVSCPTFSPLYGDLAQVRSQVHSKLNAALEMLTDSQQTAVWAAAAAAATAVAAQTAAGSSAELQGGRRLALMQLGLARSEQQQQPLLLVTLTITKQPKTAAAGNSASQTAARLSQQAARLSGPAARLSGPMRVQLLSGLASLAGVSRLAVGLTNVQLEEHAAAAAAAGSTAEAPAIANLTFTVQFGADTAAAAAFMDRCSGIEALAAAWPALQHLRLLPPHAVDDSDGISNSAGEQQQQHGFDSAPSPEPLAAEQVGQMYTVTAVLQDLHAPKQQQQQEQHAAPLELECAAVSEGGTHSNGSSSSSGVPGSSSSSSGGLSACSPPSVTGSRLDHAGCHTDSSTSTPGSAATNSPTAATAVAGAAAPVSPAAGQLAVTTSTTQQHQQQLQQHESSSSASALVASALAPALALPYAHYSLVRSDGRPMERPDKHPFALTRVIYNPTELPSAAADVWYESSDLPLRWRQTASEVHIQVLNIPHHVASAKQLSVTIEAYSIRVQEQGTGEVLVEGELARGVIPEESTWTFTKPSSSTMPAAVATPKCTAGGSGAVALAVTAAAAASQDGGGGGGAVVQQQQQQYGEGRLQLLLTKMNLELYERPWQHSASWWPQLFVDDPSSIAWDDEAKDYSDLPPAIAAEHAASAAVEEQKRAEDAERKDCREKLQALLDRHKRHRQERLNELKAAAWGRISTAASMAG